MARYKGKLQNGPKLAIKILSKPVIVHQQVCHVQLIGYCAEKSKCALAYYFMPNGSLEKYIIPQDGGAYLLDWERSLKLLLELLKVLNICIKVVTCDIQILHFDINLTTYS